MDIQKKDSNNPNTLDLNNPTTKPQLESNTVPTSRVAPTKPPKKKKKWLLVSLIVLVLALLAGFVGYKLFTNKSSVGDSNIKNISIGNTKYTSEDISKYANGLSEYQKANPNAVLYENTQQGAIDELVLNAALKKEADDKNIKPSDEELIASLGLDYVPTDVQQYIKDAKSFSDLSLVQTTRAENEAYRSKLQNDLISKRKLLVSSVSFDTPYHYEQKNPEAIEKLHQQGIDRLNNELMPLFKKGATKEEIGNSSDVSNTGDNQTDNASDYFKKLVTNTRYYKNYSTDPGNISNVAPNDLLNQLNSSTAPSSDFSEIKSSTLKDLNDVNYGAPVKDLLDTNKEIEKLKKKGDYTPVFASKSGSHMIVRLEDIEEAPYQSWNEFILQHKSNVEQESTPLFQRFKNIFSVDIRRTFTQKALAADSIPETVPYIPGISGTSSSVSGVAESSSSCSNHPFTMDVDTHEVTGTSGNYTDIGAVAYVVKVRVQQSGGCGSLINGTAWAPFSAVGNCMNGQPSVQVVDVASGWELVGGIAQPWNTQSVNADGQWGVRYFVKRTNSGTNTTVGGTSTLTRSDGGAFGNQAQISGHALAVEKSGVVSYYTQPSPNISKSWSAQANTDYTVCATAPQTVVDGQGRSWRRNDTNGQKCRSGLRNGAVANFTWNYSLEGGTPTTCQSIGASISASPSSISSGGSSTISWTGGTATSATSNFGNVNTSGSRTVSPTSTTTYTITWTAPTGSASCSTTVTVNNEPVDLCNDIEGIQPPFPPGREPDGTGNCPLTYYPWFQTQKGDVTSIDIIQGQSIAQGDPSSPPLGAKHTAPNERYNPAEAYGVIAYGDLSASASRRSGNFCSENLYILGENLTNRQNCSSSYLGGTSWGRYVSNPVNFDTTLAAVNKTWDDNGKGVEGSCSPYKTTLISTDPVILQGDISSACPGGNLMKTGSSDQTTNLASTAGLTGRGTLWVVGDLNINSNIEYSNTVATIANLPNLAIFVEGDIVIDPSVTRIDAMLISGGKIDTCKDSGDKSANKCEKQLTINGAISSLGSKIDLSRRYYKADSPNANPAELVILTPQSIIMPPPGLSIVGNESGGELQINKLELPPRL